MLAFVDVRKIKAYMSVEASLLMPFILSVLFFLFYSFFFTYNSCLAELDMGHVLIRGVRAEGPIEKVADIVLKEEKALYKEKYYGYRQTAMLSEIKRGKLCLEQKGRLDFPSTRNWEIQVRYQAAFYRPADTLRQWDRMKKLKSYISKEN